MVTEEEKKEIHSEHFDLIVRSYVEFRDNKTEPRFAAPMVVVHTLMDLGLIENKPELSEEALKRAYSRVMTGVERVNKYEKHAEITNFNSGRIGKIVRGSAFSIQLHMEIKSAFERMVSDENKSITKKKNK